MKLVFAEKPSVAMSLSKVIGANQRGDGLYGGQWLPCQLVCKASGGTFSAGSL